jgi:hypothetical protein
MGLSGLPDGATVLFIATPFHTRKKAMGFRENLKKKIRIDRLVKIIAPSTGSSGVSRKLDKEKMRELLAMGPYVMEKRRDLELYYRETAGTLNEVLVLDNELPLYGETSLEDVTLRRSPELKEMISIRNIIKILNDSDILIGKGREALSFVQDRTLETLDLHYDKKDIHDLADEALEALARADSNGVIEILELFGEILVFAPLPAEVIVNDYLTYAPAIEDADGGHLFGPIIMYNDKTNTLKLISRRLNLSDPGAREFIPDVALGKIDPDREGPEVFPFLAKLVLSKKGPTIH